MSKSAVVLISPDIQARGKEFHDLSISLSANYQHALVRAGAVPLTMPATVSRDVIAACVNACDGVLLTGGDDVDPRVYAVNLPYPVRKTVDVTPDGGGRDYREMLLVDEVFRQQKPLLAICRGHQVLNVALGGTLLADIRLQKPGAFEHRRTDKHSEIVHEVRLTPGSLLDKIARRQTLGVNSTHHQAVARIAAPLQAAAVSPDGIVESLELKHEAAKSLPFLLSVQFHPERLACRYPEHQAIFDAFARTCVGSRI